jgi:hypothetical protein
VLIDAVNAGADDVTLTRLCEIEAMVNSSTVFANNAFKDAWKTTMAPGRG